MFLFIFLLGGAVFHHTSCLLDLAKLFVAMSEVSLVLGPSEAELVASDNPTVRRVRSIAIKHEPAGVSVVVSCCDL